MKKEKEMVPNIGFPDLMATNTEKLSSEYILKFGKAIQHEWFKRNQTSTSRYYDKRMDYDKYRRYARGEQGSDITKELILGGAENSYSNYDWRPIQLLPRYINQAIDSGVERFHEVTATAIDGISLDEKNNYRKSIEMLMGAKPIYEEAKALFGVDLAPTDVLIPESTEELDLHMQMDYKLASEIAVEKSVEYTFKLNEFEETQHSFARDLVELGTASGTQYYHKTKGIVQEYVDPADIVHSHPSDRFYKNVTYFGHVKRISLVDLKNLNNIEIDDDDLEEIKNSSKGWLKYNEESNEYQSNQSISTLNDQAVDVLFFSFKVPFRRIYKKKFKPNGLFNIIKKEIEFDQPDGLYYPTIGFDENDEPIKGDMPIYEIMSETDEVWIKGAFPLGSEELIDHGIVENLVYKKGAVKRSMAPYYMVSSNMYQGKSKGLVERVIPYIDQLGQIHVKLQQIVAKARPSGINIDLTGLENIDLGGGNMLTPMEAIKIFDATGNTFSATRDIEGNFVGKSPSITENSNMNLTGLERLVGTFNHYVGLIRDAWGISEAQVASSPNDRQSVMAQRISVENANLATKHILDGVLKMTQNFAEGNVLYLEHLFKDKDLKKMYEGAIGAISVKVLDNLNITSLRDMGIFISLKPSYEDVQVKMQKINIALQSQQITLADSIDLDNISNTKQALQLLKIKVDKREKSQRDFELQKIKTAQEEGAKAAQIAAAAKNEQSQLEAQKEIAIQNSKTDGALTILKAEEDKQIRIMRVKFEYDMELKGLDIDNKRADKEFSEGKKDARQTDAQQASSLQVKQRKDGSEAIDFKSMKDQENANKI